MFQKESYNFIKELKFNNNREWFAENKSRYESAKADFEKLTTEMLTEIGQFDSDLKYLEPKKCIFRIYRDTRFSLDKTPYKTHFGAVFSHPKVGKGGGYYMHIDPNSGSFLSCGLYMLKPEELKKVRRGIYENFETFEEIINNKTFKKEFKTLVEDNNKLKKVPVGFDKEHPAAEYLKFKGFYIMKSISEKDILNENFVEKASEIFQNMQTFNDFFNDILLD